MTVKRLLFASRKTPLVSKKIHTRAATAMATEFADNLHNLNVKQFKQALCTMTLDNLRLSDIKIDGKPLLIAVCHKMTDAYNNEDLSWQKYKLMLHSMRGLIQPLHYSEFFRGDTPLTLLAKIDNHEFAWFLSQILADSKNKICDVATGVNGTTDAIAPYYLKDIPLLHAVNASSYHGAAALLQQGADPNIRDSKKKTPLDHALQKQNHDMIALLQSHGAIQSLKLSFSVRS